MLLEEKENEKEDEEVAEETGVPLEEDIEEMDVPVPPNALEEEETEDENAEGDTDAERPVDEKVEDGSEEEEATTMEGISFTAHLERTTGANPILGGEAPRSKSITN